MDGSVEYQEAATVIRPADEFAGVADAEVPAPVGARTPREIMSEARERGRLDAQMLPGRIAQVRENHQHAYTVPKVRKVPFAAGNGYDEHLLLFCACGEWQHTGRSKRTIL